MRGREEGDVWVRDGMTMGNKIVRWARERVEPMYPPKDA
jgi:hypothetical protein